MIMTEDTSTWPKDQPDERTYQILEGIPRGELTSRYPDFDVAYLWAAKPSMTLEDFRETDPRILEEGVRRSKIKSELLGELAGYHATHQHDAILGVSYCIQSLYARTEHKRGFCMLMVLNTIAYFADMLGLESEKEWAITHAGVGWRNLPEDYIDGLAAALARTDREDLRRVIQRGVALVAAEGVYPWREEGSARSEHPVDSRTLATPKLEPCKECQRPKAATEVTCPHCGHIEWRIIVAMSICTVVLGLIVILSAVYIGSPWKHVIVWPVGVCAAVFLLTIVVETLKGATTRTRAESIGCVVTERKSSKGDLGNLSISTWDEEREQD